MFVSYGMGRTAGTGGEAVLRMSRARMKLESGERLLLATRPHPAALLGALLRALGAVLAAAVAVALLAQSSAPDPVRIALDLLALALAGRAVLRFARAVWQWDRSLFALTTRRVFVVAPRGALRRAWETLPLGAIHSTGVSHSFAGRLLGYGTLTLGDGGRGRDVRFIADAEHIAETILDASPHGGRTWTQIEGPAVSDQPAPRSRLA
jgi:Bacterial PH domain